MGVGWAPPAPTKRAANYTDFLVKSK